MRSLLFSCLFALLWHSATSQCTQPVIVPSGSTVLCPGSSVTLSAPASTGSWTFINSLGGSGRTYAVAFSIGGKGYVGTGYNSSIGELNDFWEYDSTTGAWTQKADFGGGARSSAVSFGIGNKGIHWHRL